MDPFSYFRNVQVGEVWFSICPDHILRWLGYIQNMMICFYCHMMTSSIPYPESIRNNGKIQTSTPQPRSSPQATSIESWAIQSSWASWHEGIFWVFFFSFFFFRFFPKLLGEFLKINLYTWLFLGGSKQWCTCFYIFFQKRDHYLGDGFNLYLFIF